MNLISVSQFKKAQIVLRINAFLLFLFIIATPYLIKEGVWGMSEPVVEGIFLAVEISVLIRLFKSYDFYINKSNRKVNELSEKLEEQKEISVDTLKYLGKMNVQLSMIKQLVKKFKTSNKKQGLDSIIMEMLQSIAGLIGDDKLSLKIVNLNNYRTINEMHLTKKSRVAKIVNKIPNKVLCAESQQNKIDNIHILSSEHDNFSLKTFLFIENFDDQKKSKVNDEYFELIQDIVNQCEVIYLLYKSDYYKQG